MVIACAAGGNLQILEHSIVVNEFTADRSQSTATVTGRAQNTGDQPCEKCSITVTFYDYSGGTVATRSETREALQPGEIWSFKIELKGTGAWSVARYEIAAASK